MKQGIPFLKQLRLSLGISQGDVARGLGVSRPTYVLIEEEKKDLTIPQVQYLSGLYNISTENIISRDRTDTSWERCIVSTTLPTSLGFFTIHVWNQPRGEEVVFLTTKSFNPKKPVLIRVQSECMTGDIFHSYRCDCGEQKDKALQILADNGNGVFVYLRQEGRGIGLYNKIKTYALQDDGYDTHEANILLGYKPDMREYGWVKKVVQYLGIQEVRLLTNNPSKVSEISHLGIKVLERVPLIVESNQYNRNYFETKKKKFKHFFGKDEANYFYQFSYIEFPEQVEEVGKFLRGKNKDPLLKICIGVYADAYTLEDSLILKNIESIWKAAEYFEGFVPILHFTFKYSTNPNDDIARIRKLMPCVRYLRLNDIMTSHIDILRYANQFFITDMPLSNETMYLLQDQAFVQEVISNNTFILIDNSSGQGIKDTEENMMNIVNRLLSVGINDIALCGGYGPGTLDTYFRICQHYKINFSIDAETNLKTNNMIDIEKVKLYISELMNHKI